MLCLKKVEVMLKGQIKDKSIPFAYIDYDQVNPLGLADLGKYIDNRGEKKEITDLILAGRHNILMEGEKGTGKTMMIYDICRQFKIPLFEMSCGAGMNKGDIIGRPQIDNDGSYFEMGFLPKAFELANHWKQLVFYLDEFNVLPHDEQIRFNKPLDKRRSVYANGKEFRLDDGVKITFVATINPINYGGVNTLTESIRSRFIGKVLPYPTTNELLKLIDWTDVPDETRDCLLTLCQQIVGLRNKGQVDYVFSPRDIDQFCDVYRTYMDINKLNPTKAWKLEDVLNNVILIKYNDSQEREQVRIRINETFGVNI